MKKLSTLLTPLIPFLLGLPKAFASSSPPVQFNVLQQQFLTAKTPSHEFIKKHQNKLWKCTLYGASNGAKAKKNAHLYSFVIEYQDQEGLRVKNLGTQITKNYVLSQNQLRSQKDNLIDTVRLKDSKTLIAQLAMISSTHNTSVLAYAMCN